MSTTSSPAVPKGAAPSANLGSAPASPGRVLLADPNFRWLMAGS